VSLRVVPSRIPIFSIFPELVDGQWVRFIPIYIWKLLITEITASASNSIIDDKVKLLVKRCIIVLSSSIGTCFRPERPFLTHIFSVKIDNCLIRIPDIRLNSIFGPNHSICVEVIIKMRTSWRGITSILSGTHSVIAHMKSKFILVDCFWSTSCLDDIDFT